MRMIDLIQKKKLGKAHSREEIDFLIENLIAGKIEDYQLSAWLMAVYFQGMSIEETAHLTYAMTISGEVLDLSSVGPIIGDKHSTGGVGDKTTLVFVPMMAAAGIPMAKLSGRGLGHTGGTIDKLEAIPGFSCDLSTDKFVRQVKEIGAAIGAQTQNLAPADGKIYAMRDVTSTVESIPLIAASVLSKKFAAGSNLIVLDVKSGSGAFLDSEEKSLLLAKTLTEVGKILNRPVTAVITNMDQPLGRAIGHTLEVMEAIETLSGRGPDDLVDLCLTLGVQTLVIAGKYKDESQARQYLADIIKTGKALDKFRQLIEAQGGNSKVIENPSLMPQAKHKLSVHVPGKNTKWIKSLNSRTIAEACKLMGSGRAKKGDPINLAVGIVLYGKIGSAVTGGDIIAQIYADKLEDGELAIAKFNEAIVYSDTKCNPEPVIQHNIFDKLEKASLKDITSFRSKPLVSPLTTAKIPV
jgi:pyrimidine-nucleoside phosphorylase